MKVFDTQHKRKSATITSIILIVLLLIMYGFGLKYIDPPIEYGVALNFGDSNVGSGNPVEKVEAKQTEASEENVINKEEVETSEEVVEQSIQEKVITNNSENDLPSVDHQNDKEIPDPIKEKPSEVKETVKPKPSKEATDALNSLLNGDAKGTPTKGEGDDKKEGVKGDKKGDPKANTYYGNSGGGSGGNYNLAGRKALSKPIEQPDCQEEGVVVVSIEVDKNGNVIKAIPGVKGSTNTSPCLLTPAKQAALKTKWNADGKAPAKQRGTIIYKFSLSK